MLLDEPLSALDLKLRQHMRAELRAIQKRTNVTFIYITHDQGEALAMSDRVGVMSQGRLQQVAVPAGDLQQSGQRLRRLVRRREQHLCRQDRRQSRATLRQLQTSIGTFRATHGPERRQRRQSKLYVRPEHSRLVSRPVNGENAIPVEDRRRRLRGQFHQHPGARPRRPHLGRRGAQRRPGDSADAGREAAHGFDAERAVDPGGRNSGSERGCRMNDLLRRYGVTLTGDFGAAHRVLAAGAGDPARPLCCSRTRSGRTCRWSKWAGRRTSTASTTTDLLPISPIHVQVFIWTILFSSVVTVLCLRHRLSAGLLSGQGGARQRRPDAVPAAAHPAMGQRDRCAPSPGSSSWP